MKTQILITSTLIGVLFASAAQARPMGKGPKIDPETMVVELFASYDADQSDTLSAEELATGMVAIRQQHMEERAAKREAAQSARETDATDSERPKRRRGGPPAPEDLAAHLVADFDADEDGELNTAELLEAFTFIHSRTGPERPRKWNDESEE